MILAIDPGQDHSALVRFERGSVISACASIPNGGLVQALATDCSEATLAVEMIASYGMPVGAEVFDTCVWIGRFIEAYRGPHALVYRRDVKLYLCGSSRAKDANVRQALLDRFGGKHAVGTKRAPGPLYGVTSHAWSALAVAVTLAGGAADRAPESGLSR